MVLFTSPRRLLLLAAIASLLITAPGCVISQLASAMSANFEQSKEIDVPARYDGLADSSVAVLVDVPLSTQYEYPLVVVNIAENMTNRLQVNVPNSRMLPARIGMSWQYNRLYCWFYPRGACCSAPKNGTAKSGFQEFTSAGLLIFIFRNDEEPDDALHLFDDVYVSTSRELLANQMQRPRDESGLQLYMGYSGWSIGQLQAEILRGSWSTVKATSTHVFSDQNQRTKVV